MSDKPREQIKELKSYFSSCLKNFVIDLCLFINAHSYDVDNLPDINVIANKSVLGKCSKQSMKWMIYIHAVLSCGGNYHGQCGVGNLGSKLIRHFTKIPDIPGKIVQVLWNNMHTSIYEYEI